MIEKINFSEKDWQRIEQDWSAWWAHELDRSLITYEWEPVIGHPGDPEEFSLDFLLHRPADEIIDFYTKKLQDTQFFWDTFPRWKPNFAASNGWFHGAKGRFFPESCAIGFVPDTNLKNIEDLHFTFDPDNMFFQRNMALIDAALNRWGKQVSVGFSDLYTNLDLIDIFRGTQQLSLDLIDNPEEIKRLINEAIESSRLIYDEINQVRKGRARGYSAWSPLWSPERYMMIQSDFSYMISPRMFERFVLPDIAAWADFVENSFYHMDGTGQIAHLDKLLSIKKLKGIQWQPGIGQPTADHWLDVLKKIREAGKLCQVYVPLEGAIKITQELGGKGFVFTVLDYVSPQDAAAFEKSIKAISN